MANVHNDVDVFASLEEQALLEEELISRMFEATRAALAREFLKELGPKALDASYQDYLDWLEDRDESGQAISPVWFNTNKKRFLASQDAESSTSKPTKKPQRSLQSDLAQYSYEDGTRWDQQDVGTFPSEKKRPADPKRPASIPPLKRDKPKDKPKELKRPASIPPVKNRQFDVTDQKRVEDIIRRAGFQPQTMWGEDHAVSLRQSRYIDGSEASILDAYIETPDRGPRQDHGGPDGDGWMGATEVERLFAPYRKKWQPRVERLERALKDAGYKNARVGLEYGEKGHIGVNVMITNETPKVNESRKMQENTDSLVGMKTWAVWIKNNYYDGRYYDYYARKYLVIADNEEEAKQVVLENADYVLKDLLSKKMRGRNILSKRYALPVREKEIGLIEDGTEKFKASTGSRTTEILSPLGPVEVMLDGGFVTSVAGAESLAENFGPMGAPQRGAPEEPIRRNSAGWEKHPDEPDYEDDYDDEITMNWDQMSDWDDDDEPIF